VAQQINDLLQERYRTFLYSERQKELAGRDGEEKFSRVFAKEARIVAVLYRPEWGNTPWTRIEQTAIRDRAYEQGYDFCFFIGLTEPVQRPDWLPKNRLLYVLTRFGIKGAAAALESRLQELGVTASPETVLQRAERLKRAQVFADEAERYRSSQAGVQDADSAVADLVQGLNRHANELTQTGLRIIMQVLPYGGFYVVRAPHAVLVIRWERKFSNSLSDSQLKIDFYDGVPKLPGIFAPVDVVRQLETANFQFRLIASSKPAWVYDQTEIMPADMADYLMKRLMEHSEAQLRRQQK
jgi:hypothetical protein